MFDPRTRMMQGNGDPMGRDFGGDPTDDIGMGMGGIGKGPMQMAPGGLQHNPMGGGSLTGPGKGMVQQNPNMPIPQGQMSGAPSDLATDIEMNPMAPADTTGQGPGFWQKFTGGLGGLLSGGAKGGIQGYKAQAQGPQGPGSSPSWSGLQKPLGGFGGGGMR